MWIVNMIYFHEGLVLWLPIESRGVWGRERVGQLAEEGQSGDLEHLPVTDI